MFVWQPFAETPMNGFGMKHGKTPSSRPTCFAICRNVERLSAVLLGAVEAEVELDLAGRVLVVALDHVEPELLPVLDHLVDDRLELGELVDVVAVGLGDALDRRRAVRVQLEPHHLRLHPGSEVHARPSFELLLDAAAGSRGSPR